LPLDLTLTAARKLLKEIQASCLVLVRPHAHRDHPERKFTAPEIIDLVRRGTNLKDNKSLSAIEMSFMLIVRDDEDKLCELALLFEKDAATGSYIIVCHAYRKV
jgi:hypothetical protein